MHSRVRILISLAFLSAVYHASAADLTADQVDVVGITPLQSTGTPINEVPTNVQVIKSEQINKQKSSNIADLLNDNLGSVNISNGTGNSYQPDIEYRGFTASPQLGQPAGLSVYLDGMRVNEPLGEIVNWDLIPMNAISGINLMPGSNPLYGLNTLGGSLAVITKNGTDFPGYSITQSFGSWGGHQTQFEGGGEDKAHNIDYFVSGNFFEQNGWRKETSSDVNQLFGKIRWHSDNHASNLDLSFGYANNVMNQGQALPTSMMNNPSQVYTAPDVVKNQMGFINLKGSTLLSQNKLLEGNVFFRRSNSQSVASNAQVGGLGCVSSTGDGDSLTNAGDCPATILGNPAHMTYFGWTSTFANGGAQLKTTGWRAGGFFNNNGVSGTPVEASNSYSNTRQTSIGFNLQETDTSKLFNHNNSLTMGGGYEINYVKFNQTTKAAFMKANDPITYDYQSTSAQDVVGSDNALPVNGILDQTTLRSRTYNTGIFAADNFEVTEKLKVLASARFQVSQIRLGGADNDFFDTNRYEDNPGPQSTIVTSLTGKHTYSRLNPSLGLTYSPNNGLNFYGGYSEGMRAPNAMELECSDPNRPCALPVGFTADPDLKKVVAKTWEVGARGRLLSSWYWNLGLFNTNIYNDIQLVNTSSSTGYFTNVGMTNRRGVELGLAGNYEKLFVAGRYSFVDATYRSEFDMATNSSMADNGTEHITKGNQIPGIARHTVKLRADYAITPTWDVGGNAVFASSTWAHGDEFNQDPVGKIPGYGYLNLDSSYKVNSNFSTFVKVTNVLDKQYSTYGIINNNIYTASQSYSGAVNTPMSPELFVTPSIPRAAWIGVSYSFGGTKKSNVDKD